MFTQTEIALCRKIAEKHKKPVGKGDWILPDEGASWIFLNEPLLVINKTESPNSYLEFKDYESLPYIPGFFIPLWSISDCLEFIRKKKPNLCIGSILEIKDILKNAIYYPISRTKIKLLREVLTILEEEHE